MCIRDSKSTGCSPFLATYGQFPRQVMDINSVPSSNAVVEDIMSNSKKIHEQVQKSLEAANEQYRKNSKQSQKI